MNTPKQLSSFLKEYFLTKKGNNTINGHVFVDTPSVYDVGSSTNPFRAVYADSIIGTAASVDELVGVQSGATPGYLNTVLLVTSDISKTLGANTITLGLSKAPLWADGSATLTGNLIASTGVTIDGVDLSVFKGLMDTHIANYNLHISDPDAHHLKLHGITDTSHHTITGAQYSVVGIVATNSLGLLSTSSDGSIGFNTILRSSATGNLKLASLTTNLLDSANNVTIQPVNNIFLTPSVSGGVVEIATGKRLKMGTSAFTTGFIGSGGQLDFGWITAGKSTLIIDDLWVRGTMNVYEFVIQKIRATNGSLFVNDSAKVGAVTNAAGVYTITVDGQTNDYQPFVVNDQLRAQKIYLGSGIQLKKSDIIVTAVTIGGDSKTFNATIAGGTDAPEVGMDYVKIGNSSNTSRQGGIYLTSSDAGAPFIDIYDGVTSHATFGTSGTIKVRLGKLTGITDTTLNPTGYGLYSANAYLKGIVSAANDVVRMDSSGIRIKAGTSATDTAFATVNAYSFSNTAGTTLIGGLYSGEDALGYATILKALGSGTKNNPLVLYSKGGATNGEGRVFITGENGAGDHIAGIQLNSNAGLSNPYILIYTSFGGYIQANNTFKFGAAATPTVDLSADLGTAVVRWGTLYVDQIVASSVSGTIMNGQEWQYNGSMVIDANSVTDTTLSIVNQNSGVVNLSLDGSILMVAGKEVDGVDISVFNTNYNSHVGNVNAHHAQVHSLATTSALGADHTVSGLTAGMVLRAGSATTANFAILSHSDLGGLVTGDPHTQYVHTTIAKTITAVHTYTPTVAGAWVILGVNAVGQLITGMNADQLDNYHAVDFPRKAENATISGLWTFSNDLALATGAQIDFADVIEDKIYYHTTGYGVGVETGTVTQWSATNHRWRIGGTSASSGAQGMILNATGLKIGSAGAATSPLDVTGAIFGSTTITALTNLVAGTSVIGGSDLDTAHTLGRGKLGFATAVADEFAISHFDHFTASNYMIKQTSTGNVMVNSPLGTFVDLRINNSSKLKIDTVAQFSVNVGIGKIPLIPLDVLGAIAGTTTINVGDDTDTIHVLGRGKFGFATGVADEFAISHFDHFGASTYMAKQTSSGNVMFNAPSGNYVDIRNNNSSRLKIDTSNVQITANVGIGKIPVVPLDIIGAIVGTTTISVGADTDTNHIFGRGVLGYLAIDEFAIAHFDHLTVNNYMAKHTNAGDTHLNAVVGRSVYLNVDNINILSANSSGLTLATSKWIQTQTFDSTTIPINGFKISEILGNRYGLTINTIVADELRVKTFVADETRVDRGDEYWGKGYGIVETEWVTPLLIGDDGVEVWFENAPSIAGAIFSDGDWIFIRTVDIDTGIHILNIWGQVYSLAQGLVNGYLLEETPISPVNRQRWRFVLRDGAVGESIKKGMTAINFGASGQSFIHLSTVDIAGAPYISFARWSGTDPFTPINQTNEVLIGKLTAIAGPIGTVGIYSKYGNSSFELSDAGALLKGLPIQSFNGINQTFNLNSSGTSFWIGVSSGDKRINWDGTTLTIVGNGNGITSINGGNILSTSSIGIGPSATWQTDGIQLQYNAANPRFYAGTGGVLASARYVMFDGTTISWNAANTTLDTAGNLTATNATLSGQITALTGLIANWSIAGSTISATNLVLTSGAANVANIFAGTGANGGGVNAVSATTTDIVFWAGGTHANRATSAFRVSAAGILNATGAIISGNITATTGTIGGWSISGNTLTSGGVLLDAINDKITIAGGSWTGIGFQAEYNAGLVRMYIGDGGVASTARYLMFDGTNLSFLGNNTSLTSAGLFTATNAVITGNITANSGSIAGVLTIGTSGEIRQGTGTWLTSFTGLRIWNQSGIGRIGGYSNQTLQWYANTDGKLYAGAGSVVLDVNGITFPSINATAYMHFGTGASEYGRMASYTDMVGHGGGFMDIYTRTTDTTTFDAVAEINIFATNNVWTDPVGLGIHRDNTGLRYVYVTDDFTVGGNLDGVGTVIFGENTDTLNIFGRAKIGYLGVGGAGFSHYAMGTASTYALLQQSSGATYLNATSGQPISFRINNANVMYMTSVGLRIGSGTAPTSTLDVTGNATVSGSLDVGSWADSWIALTYNTGWSSFGGAWGAARYTKIGDLVMVTGLVKRTSGSAQLIGTLPVGYRPTTNKMYAGVLHDGTVQSMARMDISTIGEITMFATPTSVTYLSMEMAFRTNA